MEWKTSIEKSKKGKNLTDMVKIFLYGNGERERERARNGKSE